MKSYMNMLFRVAIVFFAIISVISFNGYQKDKLTEIMAYTPSSK